MFGERRNLILPILFDIANLVRTAADSVQSLSAGTSTAAGGEPRSIADPTHERMPSAEFLRSLIPLILTSNVKDDRPVKDVEIEPTVIDARMQDDRLQINEDDVKTASTTSNGTTLEMAPTSGGHKMARALNNDNRRPEARSWHERKMNMTNFNGSHDQYAMESEGVPLQVAMPLGSRSEFLASENLTLEEYEQLAFADLNDTMLASYVRNETTGELLPAPEMLISRLKSKNPYRKLLLGSNAIDGNGLLPCERFGTICLHVEDYPT